MTLMLPAPTHAFCHTYYGKRITIGLALHEPNEQCPRHPRMAAFSCSHHAPTASFIEQILAPFEKSRPEPTDCWSIF
jgi:hypothetical protein